MYRRQVSLNAGSVLRYCRGFGIRERDVTPVSSTHLDVSKRQELNQLFYPNLARMTSGEKGELRGTEYLVCKQIIRDHDEFAGRRGCRINAEPAEGGGFTVYFTIPRR